LDATYLQSGLFERAAALGFCAVAIGAGTLLAAWGISFLWRYTPPEIRIANPEIRIVPSEPFKVTQDKPFTIAPPEPLKIDPPGQLTVKVEPQSPVTTGVAGNTKTPTGDVIERAVTVFSNVRHGPGVVVTGWNYRDGSGGTLFLGIPTHREQTTYRHKLHELPANDWPSHSHSRLCRLDCECFPSRSR